MRSRIYPKNGKYRYNIAGREPWAVPENDVVIPSPPELPTPPSSISLLTLILPPVIMLAGTVITGIIAGRLTAAMIPMMMMAMGYPAANLINKQVQQKKYQKAMEARKKAYFRALRESRSHVEGLINQQRAVMQEEFPKLQQTLAIGLSTGENKRLWWRRPNDWDFLNLRIGSGMEELSFKILPPKTLNQKDPLSEYPFELMDHYDQVSDMPFLVDLKRLGSIVVYGQSFRDVLRLVRRMLVDIIVHHSPEDVNLFILANRRNAAEEWEWLKWAPHIHLLDGTQERQNLLFTTDKVNSFLDDLKRLFFERLESKKSYQSDKNKIFGQSYVIVLDDERVRQHEDIRRIAEEGWLVGIYLIFVSDVNVPSTYRARVEVTSTGKLHYLETFETQGIGNRRSGLVEAARKCETEPVTRALAGLEVAGGKSTAVLPSTVRVVDLIEGDPYSVPEIVERWQTHPDDAQQVLLPVGQYVDRDGLATYEIDFRPESIGGKGAYHAMMIGTTGSGKSIFMQSLVLAAAHRYSPRDINFMFMDFKAGAAELKKVSELPHSVGMVTDLSPALADRALQALENELSRRKQIFDSAGKITDIWDYNRRFSEDTMPHLVVMIDEFAEGIKILPNLVERLKELGRQGRAFGMYFFLANQEVNFAVDALKANVSWYVLLKVNRREEMNLIERRLPVPPGRGRGYVKVKSEITSIQSAYAGLPANIGDQDEAEVNEYVIATFGPDGHRNELLRFDPRKNTLGDKPIQTELELLLSVMNEAAYTLNIPHAKPIYTEPLDPAIRLGDLIQSEELFRQFNGSEWIHRGGERGVFPLGYLDIPERCMQPLFSLDFNQTDGHLWIVGAPGSGKNMVLMSIATALCLTHNPEEVHVYALEFGNGQLAVLGAFPHTAAIIRAHESERIDRLLRFFQEEMRSRSEMDWRSAGKPELYLFINNMADLRLQYPDQADEIGRFIRSGGAAGIHVIITSNRVSELPRSLSGNITNRIALQLTDSQEYLDVLNQRVPPLTLRTEGRGYINLEGNVSECQVAVVEASILSGSDKSQSCSRPLLAQNKTEKEWYLAEMPQMVADIGQEMRAAWQGELPQPIKAMEKVLTLSEFDAVLQTQPQKFTGISFPLGLYFEDLSPVYIDLKNEGPFWTILGGRQSGKSTALLSLLYFLSKDFEEQSRITLMPFKRGPLSKVSTDENLVQKILYQENMISYLDIFLDVIEKEPDLMHIVLMDDLGVVFSSGNTALIQSLNNLGNRLSMSAHENFLIVIADLYSNLRNSQTYSSSFMKLFQQSQSGVFFSMDDSDMQWFNTRISLATTKRLKWLPGRGFYANKGEAAFIQCPLVDPQDIDEKN
jgi:S-DNA-T family DNA segregation ATPase FtsK/SpoIIIE